MKNLITLILLVFLFGCNLNKNEKSSTDEESKNQYENVPFADTLFMAKDPYEFRPWQIKSFVDESGDTINKRYIKHFTNTYIEVPDTTFVYVYVEIIITRDAAGIFIHDFGSMHPPKKLMGTVNMEIAASQSDKSVIFIDTPWDSNGGFRIEDKADQEKLYYSTFINYLKNSPQGLRIKFDDEYLSDYSFYISTRNFSEEYALL